MNPETERTTDQPAPTELAPTTTDSEATATDGQPTAARHLAGLRERMARWAREGVAWSETEPPAGISRRLKARRARGSDPAPRLPFEETLK